MTSVEMKAFLTEFPFLRKLLTHPFVKYENVLFSKRELDYSALQARLFTLQINATPSNHSAPDTEAWAFLLDENKQVLREVRRNCVSLLLPWTWFFSWFKGESVEVAILNLGSDIGKLAHILWIDQAGIGTQRNYELQLLLPGSTYTLPEWFEELRKTEDRAVAREQLKLRE